jgi:hypothetical protein
MSGIPPRFKLSNADRATGVWLTLMKHFEQRIHELHGKLEGDQSAEDTAKTRGKIATYKELLRLNEDLPPQT